MKKYAIFFPQFHQVDVNDAAWGYGFTDWALVAMANAFGYWNRRAPACGFYDLSKGSKIQERFEEAAGAGLDGFGVYHYRFDDGPELDAVERYLLHAKLPENFGYFFIWANESWSMRWAGKDTELIKTVSTTPSQGNIREHVSYLKPYMEATHYTKIDGRPMFVIYRPEFFKDPIEVLACYRDEFRRVGLNPSIGYFLKGTSDIEYSKNFDFCYLFEPRLFFSFSRSKNNKIFTALFKRMIHSVSYSKLEYLSKLVGRILDRNSKVYPFSKFLAYFSSIERRKLISALKCPAQNVLTSGWNNSPRYRDQFTAVEVPSREQFSSMLKISLNTSVFFGDVPLLCNAWNEWSEGAAIEPCNYLGDTLLKSYVGSEDTKS